MQATSYKIKDDYLTARSAEWYHNQYASSPRAKLVNWGEHRAFRRLLTRVPPGGRILDVACGTGRFVRPLLDAGYTVSGVDVSPHMLEIAKRRIGPHPLLEQVAVGDAEQLAFPSRAFDGVTCMRLYHKVPPVARAQMLREVRRVGRGWAILYFAISTPWLDLRRSLRSWYAGRPSDRFAVTHRQLRRELRDAGLTLRAQAWVLPVVTEGLVVLVTW